MEHKKFPFPEVKIIIQNIQLTTKVYRFRSWKKLTLRNVELDSSETGIISKFPNYIPLHFSILNRLDIFPC